MSLENVETVRAMFEAFRRGDMAASAAPLHPEIEWDATAMPIDDLKGIYRGPAGVAAFWRRWLEAWESIDWEAEDPVDAGDHVVVWIRRQTMRGRSSGIEMGMPPYAFVWTFAGGKAVRVRFFPDKGEALRAAGVEE